MSGSVVWISYSLKQYTLSELCTYILYYTRIYTGWLINSDIFNPTLTQSIFGIFSISWKFLNDELRSFLIHFQLKWISKILKNFWKICPFMYKVTPKLHMRCWDFVECWITGEYIPTFSHPFGEGGERIQPREGNSRKKRKKWIKLKREVKKKRKRETKS